MTAIAIDLDDDIVLLSEGSDCDTEDKMATNDDNENDRTIIHEETIENEERGALQEDVNSQEWTNVESYHVDVDPLSPKDEVEEDQNLQVMVVLNEHDPEDLLVPINNVDGNSDVENDDFDSGSDTTERTANVRWSTWMQRYSWVLHDESDGEYAYCLYCDVTLHVANSKYLKTHLISLYHQEREGNYLAFKKEEERRGLKKDIFEIKQETGTDNKVTALKFHREAERAALNDFNWSRWTKAHSWIVRDVNEGTVGRCKYCKTRLNIEFSYLRKRHETSKGHREAERNCKKREVRRHFKGDERNKSLKTDKDKEYELRGTSSNEEATKNDNGPENEINTNDIEDMSFCEPVPGTSPALARCTICDTQIIKGNFRRHLSTNFHAHNLSMYRAKQLRIKQENHCFDYKKYVKEHPWITTDPTDPMYAYCKVCQKRFMYGHSEVKRKVHENGLFHKTAEQQEKLAEKTEQLSNDGGDDVGDESNNDDDEEYNVNNDKVQHQTSSRVLRGSSAWFKNSKYPWCKKYAKKKHYMFCSYCLVILHIKSSRSKHQRCQRHRNAEYILKARKSRELNKIQTGASTSGQIVSKPKLENYSPTVESNISKKSQPISTYAKIMQWKQRFPWLAYKRSDGRPNYGWCKLCGVSIYVSSSKLASKHQRTSKHLRARFEQKRALTKQLQIKTQSSDAKENKDASSIEELQEKYPWLEPLEDKNYCRCKVCDIRLPMKVLYRQQHNISKKHLDAMRAQKKGGTNVTINDEISCNNIDEMDDTGRHLFEPDVRLIEDPESDDDVSVKTVTTADAINQFIEKAINEPNNPAKRIKRIDVNSADENSSRNPLLHAMRQMKHSKDDKSPLALAEGIISSSFNIAACLTPYMQSAAQAQASNSNQLPNAAATEDKKDTIDLFFQSVSETLRSLPNDLIAEGKVKMMELLWELEMRSMRRKEAVPPGITTNLNSSAEQKMNETVESSTFTMTLNNKTNETDVNVDATEPINKLIVITDPPAAASSVQTVQTTKTVVAKGNQDFRPNTLQANGKSSLTNAAVCITPSTINSSSVRRLTGNNINYGIYTKRINDAASVRRIPVPINAAAAVSINNNSGTVRCVPLNTLMDQTKINSFIPRTGTTLNGVSSTDALDGLRPIRLSPSSSSKIIVKSATPATAVAATKFLNTANSSSGPSVNNNTNNNTCAGQIRTPVQVKFSQNK